ncbi:hypothetical protein AB0469_31805 [Streptomyces sp. NPDC093801]|uniref:hypothetical protein n=1 Tax=Streptomyces sp. NPDC093801 TaxID=3155203 RepID=UPI00344C56B1
MEDERLGWLTTNLIVPGWRLKGHDGILREVASVDGGPFSDRRVTFTDGLTETLPRHTQVFGIANL